jgi:hypothetical protein
VRGAPTVVGKARRRRAGLAALVAELLGQAVPVRAYLDIIFFLYFRMAECADVFGNVAMLRAERERLGQFLVAEGAELLGHTVLFAEQACIVGGSRRPGSDLGPRGQPVGTCGGDPYNDERREEKGRNRKN